MHRFRFLLLGAILLAAMPSLGAVEKVILDTDLGDDVDDAGTLAVLHGLATRGDIEILAVGIVNGYSGAVPLTDAINTFYGRPNLPVGSIIPSQAPVYRDTFNLSGIASQYPHDLTQDTAPEVVGLYRSILAKQPDRSVILVVVGQSTNIANLLKSPADAHSSLTGVELVRQKVKFYAAGGNGRGTLPSGQAGWNYQKDLASADYELRNFPSEIPMEFSGGSGMGMYAGSCYLEAPADHIIRKCYEAYFGGTARDRNVWDQLRLMYGALPAIRSRWNRSPHGDITMDLSNGYITWTESPNRNRSYGYVTDTTHRAAVLEEMNALMMHESTGTEPVPTAITGPDAGAILSPGQTVTVTGSGSSLSWSIDLHADGQPAFASGTGSSVTFVVPTGATADQVIRVTLQGSGGSQTRDYAIAVSSGVQPIRINFQPATAPVPAGYLVDSGAVFGDRGNGHSYGWLGAANHETRDRNVNSDQRYDTLNHMQNKGVDRVWELALPSGSYDLWLVMGDPRYADQTNHVFVEDQRHADPDGVDLIDEYTTTVTLSDGRLTIRPDANGTVGAKLMFLEITPKQTATGTGSIVREYWNGISGNAVSSIPVTTPPSGTDVLTSLEGPVNWSGDYGTRIRGYLVPPTTGSYTFWVAGDDNCELWLSTGPDAAQRRLIASVPGWTNSREWNKFATQRSAAVSLNAGQRYYIEVLHKEGWGGDNVAVGWLLPGQSGTVPSAVVPGSALAPYEPGVQTPAPSVDVTSVVLRGSLSDGTLAIDGQAVTVSADGRWEVTLDMPGETQRLVEIVAEGDGGTTIRHVAIDEAAVPASSN